MSPEWVTAVAAVWAAVATTWAAIATSRAVIATRKAPVDAAHIAASLQSESEKRRTQLWIFSTIMQNRKYLADFDCVRALNLIDVGFHDMAKVRDAWANLYAALSDGRNFPPTGPAAIIDERRAALLTAMAKELGLADSLRPDDLARVYLPTDVATDLQVRDMQRRLNHTNLSGQMATLQQPPAQGG